MNTSKQGFQQKDRQTVIARERFIKSAMVTNPESDRGNLRLCRGAVDANREIAAVAPWAGKERGLCKPLPRNDRLLALLLDLLFGCVRPNETLGNIDTEIDYLRRAASKENFDPKTAS